MVNENMWLPVGSVVKLKGGEKPIVIVGFLVRDAESGSCWDYMGYPYPEGRRDGEDLFFNKDQIDALAQVGFLNAEGCAHQSFVEMSKEAIDKGVVRP